MLSNRNVGFCSHAYSSTIASFLAFMRLFMLGFTPLVCFKQHSIVFCTQYECGTFGFSAFMHLFRPAFIN